MRIKMLMGLLFMALAVILAGCAETGNTAALDTSVYAVGSSVDKAESHVKAAENLITKAAPESNQTGKALISAASDEHAGAIKEIENGKTELITVQAEGKKLAEHDAATQAKLDKITHGLWYKIGVVLWRFTVVVITLIVLHFVFLGASLFLPGMWGTLLGKAGALVNPFGWGQAAYGYLKAKQDARVLPMSPVVPV